MPCAIVQRACVSLNATPHARAAFAHTVSRCDNDVCSFTDSSGAVVDRVCNLGPYLDSDVANGGLNFQIMSFDNILFSYNTLFHLMVVNNWQLTVRGRPPAQLVLSTACVALPLALLPLPLACL